MSGPPWSKRGIHHHFPGSPEGSVGRAAARSLPVPDDLARSGWVGSHPNRGNELPHLFKPFHSDPRCEPLLCNG